MANEPKAQLEGSNLPKADEPGHFPWKIVLAILIIGGIVAFSLVRRKQQGTSQAKGPGGRGPGGAAGGGFPVTAVIGTVESKDVPIFLDGLGTVQAFNTVSVRSRVDGTIVKIRFQEGQDVKARDVLAEIDPDPYKAMVAQAEGKQA